MPQLADVLKAEFSMQPYAVRLIRVNCCNDGVVTKYASKPDEFLENKGADAVSVPVRVDVNGILNRVAVSGPAVIRRKGFRYQGFEAKLASDVISKKTLRSTHGGRNVFTPN